MLNAVQFGDLAPPVVPNPTPTHRGDGQMSYVPRHAAPFAYHPRHMGPDAMYDADTGSRLSHAEAEDAEDNPDIYPSAKRIEL